MRVEWSDCARDDLDDLVRYISRDSTFYARLFGEKIVLAARRLPHFSESGRMIPEAETKPFGKSSSRVTGSCIVWKSAVLVLAVMHGSRDVGGMAAKPWDES